MSDKPDTSPGAEDGPDVPRVGDMAYHVKGLDPREVVRVRQVKGEWYVWLDLLGKTSGPYPADQYTFERDE